MQRFDETIMHRDMKMGLALAILLIGVVAAFFFRNDTDITEPLPQITTSEELDRQIAEKEMTPYLTGADLFETSKPTKRAKDSRSADATSDPFDIGLPGFLKESESERKTASYEPPPEPIKATRAALNTDDESDAIGSISSTQESVNKRQDPKQDPGSLLPSRRRATTPRHNAAWERTTSPSSGAHPTGHFITHRVAKGETLSGLAQTYLGSNTRFLDIFQMNRDMLRDPDDLKVGMQIKIPVADNTRRHLSADDPYTGPSPQPASQASEHRSRDSGQRPSRRFTPMPRTPFNSKTRLSPAAGLDTPDKTAG